MRAEIVSALTRHGASLDEGAANPRADVARDSWQACAADLHAAGARFFDITAIDRGDAVELALVLADDVAGTLFTLRCACPDPEPHADSLAEIFPPAEWGEREVYDMFGVTFDGHPDLTRILQPDDATIFPLRRSFTLEERPW